MVTLLLDMNGEEDDVSGSGCTLTGWYDALGYPAGGRIRVIVAEEQAVEYVNTL